MQQQNSDKHSSRLTAYALGILAAFALVIIIFCHFDTKSQVSEMSHRNDEHIALAIAQSEKLQDLQMKVRSDLNERLIHLAMEGVREKLEVIANGSVVVGKSSTTINNNNGSHQSNGGKNNE